MAKHRILQKAISIISAMAILVQTLPLQALEDFTADKNHAQNASGEAGIAAVADKTPMQADVVVIGEIEVMRNASTKHFRMSDGTYTAVDYNINVHYQDENGTWEDIDNRLSLEKQTMTSGEKPFVAAYVPRSSPLELRFSADASQVAFSYGDISVSMLHTNSVEEASVFLEEPSKLQHAAQQKDAPVTVGSLLYLPNLHASIAYENVLDNVDLWYTLHGSDMKESIIVNAPLSDYRFSFALSASNYTVTLEDDGAILLFDRLTGDVEYIIPAPYMVDANDRLSTDVRYEIEENGDVCTLYVIADAAWMNAEERAYPVVIDPTIIQNRNGGLELSILCSGVPDTPGGAIAYNNSVIGLGYESKTQKQTAWFMRPGITNIPANSVVTNAAIAMQQTAYLKKGTGQDSIYGYVHEIINSAKDNSGKEINYNNLTWNTTLSQNSTSGFAYTDTIVDYMKLDQNSTDSYVYLDVTVPAKHWYENRAENLGVLVTADRDMDDAQYAEARFEKSSLACIVEYRSNVGLEDYFTYHQHAVGYAGDAYICDNSAQLTLVHKDASYGGVISYTLSHIYNTAYAAGEISAAAVHALPFLGTVGKGWKLSAQQSIKPVSMRIPGTSSNLQYLVYLDGDGTEHYFQQGTQDNDLYYDEDGLGLMIQVSGSDYRMTDDIGNTVLFVNGYLTKITDTNGNTIYFVYNSSTADPSAGTSTAWHPKKGGSYLTRICQRSNAAHAELIPIATLTYDVSTHYLSSVTDRVGNVTHYLYENGNLTKIVEPDGSKVFYTYYQYNNCMSAAYDVKSGYTVTYSYAQPGDTELTGGYTALIGMAEYSLKPASGSGITDIVAADRPVQLAHGERGAFIGINSTKEDLTIFRDSGANNQFDVDVTNGAADDTLYFYVFDHYGRTISQYATDAYQEKIYTVGAGTYT